MATVRAMTGKVGDVERRRGVARVVAVESMSADGRGGDGATTGDVGDEAASRTMRARRRGIAVVRSGKPDVRFHHEAGDDPASRCYRRESGEGAAFRGGRRWLG
jgi:hypothetical protein